MIFYDYIWPSSYNISEIHRFRATFNAFQKSCGGNYSGIYGIIESPNWPNSYTDPADCEYRIQVPEGHSVLLEITDFHLEFDVACEHDYVQVYEENDGILTEVGSPLCGKDFPKEISTVNNSMVVKYKSDNSSNGQGFHMYYKAVKNVCGGNYSGNSGEIYSPHWPNRYPSPSRCRYTINVPAGFVVELKITFFDLGYSHDYIQL